MFTTIDSLFVYSIINNFILNQIKVTFVELFDVSVFINHTIEKSFIIINTNFWNLKYLNWYVLNYYSFIIESNLGYILPKTTILFNYSNFFYFYILLEKIFKINLFIFIIYTIFFITNFENYIKQLKVVNNLAKLFILNATEKEVGPVDDYFFFAVLFFLTISLFVFTSFVLLIVHSSIFIWSVSAFFFLTFLILTIPVNLFIDFGIVFCVAIKGSASGNNFIKELLFDIISTTTVFIRFVIQNIRFFFIFSGIFELLEWVFSNNNNLFISNNFLDNNIFFNYSFKSSYFNISQLNCLLVNSLLFVILYFYYILHLLFLLLVQVTIYIGISIWLFFFLYSTKFLTKYEKYFVFKKLD